MIVCHFRGQKVMTALITSVTSWKKFSSILRPLWLVGPLNYCHIYTLLSIYFIFIFYFCSLLSLYPLPFQYFFNTLLTMRGQRRINVAIPACLAQIFRRWLTNLRSVNLFYLTWTLLCAAPHHHHQSKTHQAPLALCLRVLTFPI